MIDGLSIIPGFVSEREESDLMEAAERIPFRPCRGKLEAVFWDDREHYEPLPEWTRTWSDMIGLGRPWRLIISDYAAGKGMHEHADMVMPFRIVGGIVSLLSDCWWIFRRRDAAGALLELRRVLVPARSLMTFRGPARYEWTHEVEPVPDRRVSFYFSFKEQQ